MAKHFEILGTMANRNLDIRQFMDFVSVKTVSAGGHFTMGVNHETAVEFALKSDKFYAMLLVVDADQYEQIKKELDSAEKSEKCG